MLLACSKLVYIWLVKRGSGKFYFVSRSVTEHIEPFLLEPGVGLHGPVHIGAAADRDPQVVVFIHDQNILRHSLQINTLFNKYVSIQLHFLS